MGISTSVWTKEEGLERICTSTEAVLQRSFLVGRFVSRISGCNRLCQLPLLCTAPLSQEVGVDDLNANLPDCFEPSLG